MENVDKMMHCGDSSHSGFCLAAIIKFILLSFVNDPLKCFECGHKMEAALFELYKKAMCKSMLTILPYNQLVRSNQQPDNHINNVMANQYIYSFVMQFLLY